MSKDPSIAEQTHDANFLMGFLILKARFVGTSVTMPTVCIPVKKQEISSMTKVISVTHEVGKNITVPSFMYNHEGGEKVYLHLGVLKGTPVVIVNGKEAYRWERGTCPAYNDGRTPIYADISDAISLGENTIEVVLDGDLKQFRSETFDIYTSTK